MTNEIVPVIMAGGAGTRLWPASRQLRPKQFLPLIGPDSLFQLTLQRLDGLACDRPIVVCNEEHRFLAAEQLRQSGLEHAAILLEPQGRNTAPAIALAALHALSRGNDPLLLVLAADHLIADTAAFHAAVGKATGLASQGKLVTFGIVPRHPETGYGYIKRGAAAGDLGFAVERFVEKPDLPTAESYLQSGDYFWNSGMFMFRASVFLSELERHEPAVLAACRNALAATHGEGTGDKLFPFVRVDADAFAASPKISVDYAVMERTDHACMVPFDAGWNDVGSWAALLETGSRDGQGNVTKGDVLSEDTTNCLMMSDNGLVACVGVKDLIVVSTHDAVLVAHKDKAQNIGKIVDRIKALGRHEHIHHRQVYRPWGCYDSVDNGQRHQVKRITVNPGAKLSLQYHHHRAEHWVVVRGTARVVNGERSYLVSENESTYIPIGQMHSLENPGSIPLELIEVQSGSYLGEDDIVRVEDVYGRIEDKK